MFFRLGNEIRKRREEEDRNITEKYQAQKLPKLREATTRRGARRKKQNGGRLRSSGIERRRRIEAWRRKRRGKGQRKIEAREVSMTEVH